MESTELAHYGVKGMKWGVRRYQNKDGSLTSAGKKRQRIQEKSKDFGRIAKKGAKAVSNTLAKIGTAYVADQVFFGGMGTAACKEAIRVVGMATITAVKMARGGYDIKWYDKSGNRVG